MIIHLNCEIFFQFIIIYANYTPGIIMASYSNKFDVLFFSMLLFMFTLFIETNLIGEYSVTTGQLTGGISSIVYRTRFRDNVGWQEG